jgi:hypothetical protein
LFPANFERENMELGPGSIHLVLKHKQELDQRREVNQAAKAKEVELQKGRTEAKMRTRALNKKQLALKKESIAVVENLRPSPQLTPPHQKRVKQEPPCSPTPLLDDPPS